MMGVRRQRVERTPEEDVRYGTRKELNQPMMIDIEEHTN